MSIKFFQLKNSNPGLKLVGLLILLNLVLCLVHVTDWVPLSGDQIWFYTAAQNSLAHGGFPLVFGIKSSITWLHHGALWLYILIPAFLFSGFHPLAAHILTVILGLFTIPLIYYLTGLLFGKKAALLSAFTVSVSGYFILLSRTGYHTSLIPLLLLISSLNLVKKRHFLSGLFLGFLYQVHLLACIYWPLAFIYLIVNKRPFAGFIIGSVLGLLPFLLVGPVQTFGIIAWLLKYILTNHGSSGVSFSQLLVLLIPLVLAASAALSRVNSKLLVILGLFFFLANINYLAVNRYYPPSFLYRPDYGEKLAVSRRILAASRTGQPEITVIGGIAGVDNYSQPYLYLLWWLHRQGIRPAGTFSRFTVDESTLNIRMLE